MGHFLHNLPRFSAAVWHTQRMKNFVTIFLWRFFAPVWHKAATRERKIAREKSNEIRHSLCMPHGRVKIVAN